MSNLFQNVLNRKPFPEPLTEDSDLESFFTDADYALQAFEDLISASPLLKQLLIIHGVGGVGKSVLLKMYRLICYQRHLPVALIGAEDVPSSVDVLGAWAKELNDTGVRLRAFTTIFAQYRTVQAKVEAEAKKASKANKTKKAMKQAIGGLGKTTAKTLVEMAANTIPVIGPLVASLGGTGTEALIDWLGSFLPRSDVDLFMQPAGPLTSGFLKDLVDVAKNHRIVLMLDTYEQMGTLDDWVRELAYILPDNVLLVLAGRTVPDWNRKWPGWMGKAKIIEHREMTDSDLTTLVNRYYAYIHIGTPDVQQVKSVTRFARGLPIAATTAVQLWVKYGLEDFDLVRPQVLADLVDRFLENVPQAIRPAFEVAAVLRSLNVDSLRALLEEGNPEELYTELRRWPFVRPRGDGLKMHDTMREMINEALRIRTPSRYHVLHTLAAKYYENIIGQFQELLNVNEEWQRIKAEQIYHHLAADEVTGLDLMHSAFIQGLAYLRYQFCHQLINDAEFLKLTSLKSSHRIKFYKCLLLATEFSWAFVAEEELKELVEEAKSDVDVTIQWEILFNYGQFLQFSAKDKKARKYFRKSLESLQTLGHEENVAASIVLEALASTYGYQENPSKRQKLLEHALSISIKVGEAYTQCNIYGTLGHGYFEQNRYDEAKVAWQRALTIAYKFKNHARIAHSLNRLAQALIALGELEEAETTLFAAMEAANHLPNTLGGFQEKEMYIKRHFGLLYRVRGEYDKAIAYFSESVQIYRERKSVNGRLRTLILLADCLYVAGRRYELEALAPEIEELMTKTQLLDWIARWRTIEGHMLLDMVMQNTRKAEEVTEKYRVALTTALFWSANTLDEIVEKISWRMRSSIDAENKQIVLWILDDLIRFWETGELDTKPLTMLENEQRKRLARSTKKESASTSQVIERFKLALNPKLLLHEPVPWYGL